jgi:hypothetical protein
MSTYRCRRHQQAGDLKAYGYSRGSLCNLFHRWSLALRFHPSTDTLLRFLSPDREVIRIGLAESWRHGIRNSLPDK